MDSLVEVGRTLNYVIDSSCSTYKESPAIGMATEKPLTYGEFHQKILALADRLQDEDIKKGDRVAILGENSHNWGMAYLASVRLGAVAVPILPDLPESDVHHILGEMEVKALFTTQRQIEKIYELPKEINGPVVTLDDFESELSVVAVTTFTRFLDEALAQREQRADDPVFPRVGEDDLASILYTSGTSGYSKAVMLSHKNLTADAYSAASLMDIEPGADLLQHTVDDLTGDIPVCHLYPVFGCNPFLQLGKPLFIEGLEYSHPHRL